MCGPFFRLSPQLVKREPTEGKFDQVIVCILYIYTYRIYKETFKIEKTQHK